MDQMEIFDDKMAKILKRMGEQISKKLEEEAMATMYASSTSGDAMFSNLEAMVQKGQADRVIMEVETTSSPGEPWAAHVKSAYYMKMPITTTSSTTSWPSPSTIATIVPEGGTIPATTQYIRMDLPGPTSPACAPEEPDTGKRKSMKDKEIEKLRAKVGELQLKLDSAEKTITKLTTGNPYRGMRTRKEVEEAVARCTQMAVRLELQWVLGELE